VTIFNFYLGNGSHLLLISILDLGRVGYGCFGLIILHAIICSLFQS